MKYLLALFVLLVGCGACSFARPATVPDPVPNAIEDMRSTTVAVLYASDDGDMRVGCAGVWVGKSSFLTAAHCTEPEDAYTAAGFAFLTYAEIGAKGSRGAKGGPYHLAVVAARDEVQDLALLSVLDELPPHRIGYVSPFEPLAGQHVNMVGHTSGYPYSWAPGWVSAIRKTVGPDPIRGLFTQVATEGRGGNSGGGLWDDDGQLVGVASYADMHGWTWFVARQTIASFLTKNLVD